MQRVARNQQQVADAAAAACAAGGPQSHTVTHTHTRHVLVACARACPSHLGARSSACCARQGAACSLRPWAGGLGAQGAGACGSRLQGRIARRSRVRSLCSRCAAQAPRHTTAHTSTRTRPRPQRTRARTHTRTRQEAAPVAHSTQVASTVVVQDLERHRRIKPLQVLDVSLTQV
jgi:hypothetical protein